MEKVRSSLMAAAVLVAAGLVVGSCGSSAPDPNIDQVHEPVVSWIHFNGLCSWMVAVDGDRKIRTEEACEKGPEPLPARGEVSANTFQALHAAVEALPPTTATLESCLGSAHIFGIRSAGMLDRMVCADRARPLGDPSGLPEPFISVAAMFQAIEPR
jgi:hypothetical protein